MCLGHEEDRIRVCLEETTPGPTIWAKVAHTIQIRLSLVAGMNRDSPLTGLLIIRLPYEHGSPFQPLKASTPRYCWAFGGITVLRRIDGAELAVLHVPA